LIGEKNIRKSLEELRAVALKNMVTEAAIIKAGNIVVDERVVLKCRNPPCEHYGRNLMCPPFAPTPEQFRRCLKKYKWGVLIEVEETIPKEIGGYLERGWSLPRLRRNKGFRKLYDPWEFKA